MALQGLKGFILGCKQSLNAIYKPILIFLLQSVDAQHEAQLQPELHALIGRPSDGLRERLHHRLIRPFVLRLNSKNKVLKQCIIFNWDNWTRNVFLSIFSLLKPCQNWFYAVLRISAICRLSFAHCVKLNFESRLLKLYFLKGQVKIR